MNVMLIGDSLFTKDMAWGFEQLGHRALFAFPQTPEELDDCLLSLEPDLLITMGSPSYFPPELLECLNHRLVPKAKFAHWDTDGITWADIEIKLIRLLEPDMVFTVCPEMLSLLKGHAIPSLLLPYAYSPITHHPGPANPEYANQIAFVGGAYPTVLSAYPGHFRRSSLDVLFKPLLDSGYRIDLYGDTRHKQVIHDLYHIDIPSEWVHDRCPYETTWQIYSGCAINLVTQNHDLTVTKRTFEIMGSGGLALSLSNAAIHEMFTPGKDMAVSSSPEETLELVKFYLKHPSACETMRKNALTSVKRHTYKQRAECIVSRLMPDER